MAEIRELQVRQQMIVDDIKAIRVDQVEMVAIRAGEEKMRAAISHIRSTEAHFKSTLSKRVQSFLTPMDQNMQIVRDFNRHQTFTTGLAKQLTKTLPEATKRGLETTLAEAEDRVSHEGSGKAAIRFDRGRPLLPRTKRLVCLPCRDTPQKDFPEEDRPKPEKREESTGKNELVTSCPPRHNATFLWKGIHTNLKVIGRIGNKPCIVTVDTGASVTIARPDIVAGLPERETTKKAYLRTISGQAFPILKEALVTLTLGKRQLIIWVFVANTTEEFTLGLDVLYAYNAVVDLCRNVLRLGWEEVPLGLPSNTYGKEAKARRVTDAEVLLQRPQDSYKQPRKDGFLGRPAS